MSLVNILVPPETASALDRARAEIDDCPVDADYATVIAYTLVEAGIGPHGEAELEVSE